MKVGSHQQGALLTVPKPGILEFQRASNHFGFSGRRC
jgi:hypothetical protein